MDIYTQQILDHYKNPRNFGEVKSATVSHQETNPHCGDKLTVYLKIEKDIIKQFTFDGVGCAISMGASSILSKHLQGISITDAKKLTKKDVHDFIQIKVGKHRTKCALLSLLALKNALLKWKGLKEITWSNL